MKTRSNLASNSFKGQVISVGIDVHKKSWSIALIMKCLFLKRYSCDPDVEMMIASLEKSYPGATFIFCYEAGFCGFWIYRKLTSLGYKCIVVNPADIPQTQKEELSKTDSIDCTKLARELDKNSLTPIYIPEVDEEAFRDLYRVRSALIKDQTSTKNRIKSFLNRYNIELIDHDVRSNWSNKHLQKLKEVEFPSLSSRIAFRSFLKQLDDIILNISSLEQEIKKIIEVNNERKEVYNHLITIPGIGNICALGLLSELINMERFKSDNDLLSYIGLIPTTRNSGDKEYSRGVTFRHKRHLRNTIIESSWIAIRKDPALLLVFNKLCSRMNKNKAILRIAKKLIKRVRSIWVNKQDYVVGVIG